MNKGLFAFLFLISFAHSLSAEEYSPGLCISANATFFNQTMQIAGPIILRILRDLVLLNKSGSINLNVVKFNYSLDALYFNASDANFTQTFVSLDDGKLTLNISDLSLWMTAATHFTTDPPLFFGGGSGFFNLSRLNTSTTFSLDLNKNKMPMINLEYSFVNVSERNLNMSFAGTNDVYTLLDMAKGFLIPTICKAINGTMDKKTREAISKTINGVFEDLPTSITIPGTDISIDYSLVASPSMKNKYLPIALNGTAKCINKTACTPYTKRQLTPPPKRELFDGPGSLQILISDYLLDTVFTALYEDNLMKFKVGNQEVKNMTNGSFALDTDVFSIFIPHMRELYGKKKEISINGSVIDPPFIMITPNLMTLNTSLETTVYVNASKEKPNIMAMDIELNIQFDLNVNLSKNKLKGNIANYIFAFKLLKQDPELKVTMDELNGLFRLLFQLAIPQINVMLNEGIPIPPLYPFFDLKDSSITQLDRYLRLDFNPVPVAVEFEKLIGSMFQSVQAAYSKVMSGETIMEEEGEHMVILPDWINVREQGNKL